MPPGVTGCTRPVALGILAVVMALAPVSAEPRFGLGRLEGDAGVGFELGRKRTRVDGAVESESLRTRSDERLQLRNSGAWILAPGLATASFGATFGLLQEDAAIDGQDLSRRGRLLGYSFETVLLSDMPYTLTLFANRNETVASREFGGVSDTAFTNRGGSVRLGEDSILRDLGVRHFTSTLGARQEWTGETTTVLGQSFVRDEQRTVLTYEGNKGFETADLGLRYELTALEDRVNPLGSFRAHAATLSYSLDFGPTLNRRWDSYVRYAARTGASPNTFVSVDEALRLDHAENLFTDYRYLFSRSETPAGATNAHVGTVKAQHRLYQSLTTSLTGQGTLQELDGGTRASYAGQIDLDYQRKLGGYGRLLAGTGLRYQMDEQQLRRGRIDVLDEAHTAPARLGGDAGFTLANRFVIGSSIVVVDTRGGARLPAVAGVDYVVRQDGDFTKIVPLVGSAVILSGDPLAVSYSFELDPSAKFSTTTWRTTAGLDFGWVALSLAHEQSDQSLVSERDGNFLDDRRRDGRRSARTSPTTTRSPSCTMLRWRSVAESSSTLRASRAPSGSTRTASSSAPPVTTRTRTGTRGSSAPTTASARSARPVTGCAAGAARRTRPRPRRGRRWERAHGPSAPSPPWPRTPAPAAVARTARGAGSACWPSARSRRTARSATAGRWRR